MNAWMDVITAGALGPWAAAAPGVLLAGLRWFGLLLWLPGLGAAGVTLRLRIALALLLGIATSPATGSRVEFTATASTQPLELLQAAVGELVLGSLLGLGVSTVFAALKLAGELIDQQAGLALQQTLDPFADAVSGPSSKALSCLGLAAFFTLATRGGEVALVDTLLQQFQTLPPGAIADRPPDASLLVLLVQQSLTLAVDVAGPAMAVLSLITMAAAWIGRSSPRWAAGDLATPLRLAACLALLSASAFDLVSLLAERFDALSGTAAEHIASLGNVTSRR